jgi:hypothetical protein
MLRFSTLLAFLMLTLPGLAQQTLHYEENFDNNTSGWAVWDNHWNSARFDQGAYMYEMKGNYSHQTWNNGIRINVNRDFAIETRFTLLSGQPGESSFWLEWGLANSGRDYFAFGIYSDGHFQYGRAVNSKWVSVTGKPVASPVILTGINKSNILRVERKGTSMVFLINGTEVYRSSFETFLPNSVAGFQANGPQRLAVDYLRIYQEPEPVNTTGAVPAADLFPVLRNLDKNTSWKSGYLFTGCVTGNCSAGKGIYIEVYLDRWDENRGKLKYKLYEGEFRNNSRYFNGRIYYRDVLVTRKNNRKDFEPESGPVAFGQPEKTGQASESGEMVLTGTDMNNPGVRFYSRNGKSEGMRVRSNTFYAEGYYHNGEPVYMYLRDNAGNQFWGFVNQQFDKLAGYELSADGTVYTGGFYNERYFGPGRRTVQGKTEEGIWNRGGLVAEQQVFIPDTALLKKAALEIAGNTPFSFRLDSLNAEEYHDMGFAGRCYSADGVAAKESYSGNGLMMGFDHQFYFGSIKNGRAQGIGLLSTPAWTETNFPKNSNAYGGFFELGKFMVGPVVHKTRTVEIGKDIAGLLSALSSDPNFQEERMMLRKGNYTGMLLSLRAKAQKGVPNAVYHIGKFNEFFTCKEDFYVNKATTPDLQKILDSHFAGNSAEAFRQLQVLADQGNAEAMYYLAAFYQKGIATDMFIGKSDEYYRKSVIGGYTRAAMPLARKYMESYESVLRYGVSTYKQAADSAMKYFLSAAQSRPSESISPAEIQEAKMGYYRTKYPDLRKLIRIDIELGDDMNTQTYFGQVVANDQASKKRQADLTAQLKAGADATGGRYFRQNSTHQIVYVEVSDGKSYMAPVIFIHQNTGKNFKAGISISDLLNRQLYAEVNSAKIVTCSVCNGEGVTRRAYKKTVADYEYTLGVKVVQSGSTASSCGACGGCGLGVR